MIAWIVRNGTAHVYFHGASSVEFTSGNSLAYRFSLRPPHQRDTRGGPGGSIRAIDRDRRPGPRAEQIFPSLFSYFCIDGFARTTRRRIGELIGGSGLTRSRSRGKMLFDGSAKLLRRLHPSCTRRPVQACAPPFSSLKRDVWYSRWTFDTLFSLFLIVRRRHRNGLGIL